MKIAHFPGSFLPKIGGAQIVVHNLAKAQATAGHTVHVITQRKNRKFFDDNNIQTPYQIKSPISRSFGLTRRLRNLMLPFSWIMTKQIHYLQCKYRYDLWHFNLIGEYAFIIVPYLKQIGIPVIGTFHGADIQVYPEVDYGLRRDRSFDRSVRKTIRLFDTVTAISETIKNEYKKLGVPEGNIYPIPNGIDVNRIKSIEIDKKQIRKKYGLPNDKKIIITVGRNHPKKGFNLIPHIIKKIIRVNREFLWILIGSGNEEILSLAENQGVSNYIRIIPEISVDGIQVPSNELILLFKASDIFGFPTIVESFGIVVIEAMAAGLPIVTTDAPGARDIVIHGCNGLLSPVKDTKAMSKNIVRVLRDKTLRENLIKNGLNDARHYSWSIVAEKYEQAYMKTRFNQ